MTVFYINNIFIIYMIKLKYILAEILKEGGASGHMAHPFDIAKTGEQLIKVFEKTIESLKKSPGSVKIDGVNASVRLIKNETTGNHEFVLDRGSAKPLDIKGIRPEDMEARFGEGHGFLNIGPTVIKIFDEAIPSTKNELEKMGLWNDPNIMFNVEYVEGGKTNVTEYGDIGNFLAIHGLNKIKTIKTKKDGITPSSRGTTEIDNYDKSTLETYIKKLNKIANKRGFKVLGSVGATFKKNPNLDAVLQSDITLMPYGKKVTKSLQNWLEDVTINTPLIRRTDYQKASQSKNISEDFKSNDINKIVNDTIVYIATIKLGDEILKNLTSEIGDLENHEGTVVRDVNIYEKGPFKITGSFITRGLESTFGK